MINWRKKDFNDPPETLYNAVRLAALREAEVNLDGDEIKSNHYRFEEILTLLKAYSIDKENFDEETDVAKCYYCESTPEVVASLQVEHYRPKKRIDDENRHVVPGTNGYYWLGLEWSNLVLACPKCNGSGAKGNIFTISGPRVSTGTNFDHLNNYVRNLSLADTAPLIDEQPDLLHPEIDNSYEYLAFNHEGKISHKQPRGERTIQICKLDRKPLDIARNNVISKFFTEFSEVIGWYQKGYIHENQIEVIFTEKCIKLRNSFKKSLPYTLLTRYMIEEFETFFVLRIPNEYQEKLRNAFINSTT